MSIKKKCFTTLLLTFLVSTSCNSVNDTLLGLGRRCRPQPQSWLQSPKALKSLRLQELKRKFYKY